MIVLLEIRVLLKISTQYKYKSIRDSKDRTMPIWFCLGTPSTITPAVRLAAPSVHENS